MIIRARHSVDDANGAKMRGNTLNVAANVHNWKIHAKINFAHVLHPESDINVKGALLAFQVHRSSSFTTERHLQREKNTLFLVGLSVEWNVLWNKIYIEETFLNGISTNDVPFFVWLVCIVPTTLRVYRAAKAGLRDKIMSMEKYRSWAQDGVVFW